MAEAATMDTALATLPLINGERPVQALSPWAVSQIKRLLTPTFNSPWAVNRPTCRASCRAWSLKVYRVFHR